MELVCCKTNAKRGGERERGERERGVSLVGGEDKTKKAQRQPSCTGMYEVNETYDTTCKGVDAICLLFAASVLLRLLQPKAATATNADGIPHAAESWMTTKKDLTN